TDPSPSSRTASNVSKRLMVMCFVDVDRHRTSVKKLGIYQLAKKVHRKQRDRKKEPAGVIVIDSSRQLGIDKFCHQDDGEKAADIADDGKDNREGEDNDLFPKLALSHVN